MNRLLFDVTRLVESGLHTGIQRVVRCLLAACERQFPAPAYQVLAVTFQGEQWQAFSALSPHPCQGLGELAQAQGQPIEPGDGDILLMFDASWYTDPWPAVDAALARGARLAGMVHDLLPLEHAEWFREGLQQRFADHLNNMAERAERLFVPTEAVRGRLIERLAGQGSALPVSVLAHGGDFCELLPDAAQLQALQASLPAPGTDSDPLYLVLGTLEPRKNHSLVLDAFDALWARGHQSRLLLVGKVGWQVDPLLERLHNHPLLNRRLFHGANLSDPQLRWLISQSTALIYVPKDEGFGLPVLEASMLGCPVIASDIAVLREAGGQWPCFITPDSLPELITAIETDAWRTANPPAQRTWDQVARKLGTFLNMVNRAQ